MKFNQIIAPSMKELFIKEIEALILSGQLKVGEKLPTERELADEMKISRTIVNLGLSELKNKGLSTSCREKVRLLPTMQKTASSTL